MAAPRVLVVYANPATFPPVPPYGAERVAQAFAAAGCDVDLVTPFLGLHPLRELADALEARPDLVALSIRQIDDGLVVRARTGDRAIDTRSYLPAIARLVRVVRAAGAPILAGGSGLSAAPEGVLGALGLRHGVIGPADDLVERLGRALVAGRRFPEALPDDPRVVDLEAGLGTDRRAVAVAWQAASGPTPRAADYLAIARVRGFAVPVQLSAGCNRRCSYCVEASFLAGAIVTRPVTDVVDEIRLLAADGVRRVHLVASELNVPDARHTIAVLRAIVAEKLEVDLEGFVNPAPVPDELLDALAEAGVAPGQMVWELGHLDPELLRRGAGPANRSQIDRLVECYVRRGYPSLAGSILLGAHPDETWDSVDRALAAARAIDAALAGGLALTFATGGRVYASAPLGRWVRENFERARPDLYGAVAPDLAAPVVFCRPTSPRRLFAHVSDALAGLRGRAAPLNAEADLPFAILQAEKLVNLAITQAERGADRAAIAALEGALRLVPGHGHARAILRQLISTAPTPPPPART